MAQVALMQSYYKDKLNNNLPEFNTTGFKVFSQFEEDGKLLYIFSVIGMGNKTFVDLGSNDGINSNCANLAIHFNWKGLFVDGDSKALAIGQKFYEKNPGKWHYKPTFLCSYITTENINKLLKENDYEGEIDLLSIDIDGNDYWIWRAIEAVQPKVVIIESQVAFGDNEKITPYNEQKSLEFNDNDYLGASTKSLQKLGNQKGYRLIGTNEYGNNLFFIKNGIGEKEFPEINASETLSHPFAKEKINQFKKFTANQ